MTDYSFKAGLFRAGLRGLAADVDLSASPGELGFVARFQEQPDWQLPFLVEPLLRASLRYPFEGPGSQFETTLRAEQGRGELASESRARLRESWIVRWLGGFTTKAPRRQGTKEIHEPTWCLGDLVVSFLRSPKNEADKS